MITMSAELLSLSSDAALLVKSGKISYCNTAAEAILGKCVGKSVKSVLGDEPLDAQSPCYTGEICLKGSRYLLRMSGEDGLSAIFLTPADTEQALISNAFLCTLRGGLMSMNVSMELIRDEAQDREDVSTLEKLREINRTYHRLNRLSTNMAVIDSVRCGGVCFNPIEFDLVTELLEITDTVGILIGDRNRIKVHFPATLTVRSDRRMIAQLYMELLSNALTHSGCSSIRVSLLPHRGNVVLAVDDDGCGIPAGELHTVFERYRCRKDVHDITGGAGLGLTAARYICRIHGGTLLLESRAGKGTTVRASFLRKAVGEDLRSPMMDSHIRMSDILTSMSDCLPDDCFSERFGDE